MNEKIWATSPKMKAALESIRCQFKGHSAKAQCQRLLEALRLFPVTTYEGMRYLDIYWVPSRVRELRDDGYVILTHRQTVTTEAGETHRVGQYVLMSEADHE